YLLRFPELAPELRLQFDVEEAIRSESSSQADGHPTVVVGHPAHRAAAGGPAPGIPGDGIPGGVGRGGRGGGYKAPPMRPNRIGAVKMIVAGDHAAPEAALRFMAEAESVARLHHPHIVQIFAYGECDGRPYFEMEYVDGGSLADRLGGTSWSAREAARLV